LGWRVNRTTTNSGTKKIRRVVRLFGRFIAIYERTSASFQTATVTSL
jgi:hypothetical protein